MFTMTNNQLNEDMYTKEEVKRLLGNYYRLDELNAFSQDGTPITYKIDIDRALLSNHLLPQHLEVIGLHYACQLSHMQIQMYTGTSIEQSMKNLDKAVTIITNVLNGTIKTTFKKYTIKTAPQKLLAYVFHIKTANVSPFMLSDGLQKDILELTQERDSLAKETLRQLNGGKPSYIAPEEKIEYPWHNEACHTKSIYKDYFTNQDRKNGVTYDEFDTYASDQIVTGYKKANLTNDSLLTKKAVRR